SHASDPDGRRTILTVGPFRQCAGDIGCCNRPEKRGRKMPGLLEGHIAAVTGAGSGIGRAIARGHAKEGAQVVLLDANGVAASETVRAITGAGGKAVSFVLDVTERDKCREVAEQIGAQIGQVSILVNNAGINRRNAFTADAEAVIKDWQDVMA